MVNFITQACNRAFQAWQSATPGTKAVGTIAIGAGVASVGLLAAGFYGPAALAGLSALGLGKRALESLMSSPQIYDHVVVGGGAAGIFTAEVLSRDGSRVLLLEKHDRLAVESSGEQHGWAQFGALYLNSSDARVSESCLENVNLLLEDYSGFSGNNLRVNSQGDLVSINHANENSWYKSNPVYFYYPDSNNSKLKLTPAQRKEWDRTIARVMSRTEIIAQNAWGAKGTISLATTNASEKRAFNTKKTLKKWKNFVVSKNPNGFIARRMKNTPIAVNPHEYSIVQSHDRSMRSVSILRSIRDQFINNGGEERLGVEVASYQEIADGSIELITANQNTIAARHVVFTTGGGLTGVKGAKISTVLSPLLVVTPAVCESNVVHLTPIKERTINHFFHTDPATGKTYSLIGNGDAISAEDTQGIEQSKLRLIVLAEEFFPAMATIPEKNRYVYFGHKNEILKANSGNARNYHYEIAPLIGNRVLAAVPGKFTLAPALAHRIYWTIHGKKAPPSPRLCNNPVDTSQEIATQLHRQIVAGAVDNQGMRIKRNHLSSPRSALSVAIGRNADSKDPA